ncbi:MAG TPA: hypothetical protein VHR16_07610 [Candidatus Limnocylindrales bacterium]|nr:hypothetical protein [Candidatus Limnocylindrales bacterium]
MSIYGNAVRGAIAGAAATWAMDQVTTVMLAVQAPEVTRQETAAQANGKSSVTNLVDRVEAETGMIIPPARRPLVETLVHYALGAVPGAIYGVVRRWIPFARAGSGLFYGLGIFAANDEYLNTKLGLASAPSAYPPETHIRGLAGHAVLGVATETGIQLLGG